MPAVAAGAIIGKGGETIAAVQKDTGARVKMSKSHDFYPGMCASRQCYILLQSIPNNKNHIYHNHIRNIGTCVPDHRIAGGHYDRTRIHYGQNSRETRSNY